MLRPATTSTGHGVENDLAAAPYDELLIDPAARSSHRTTHEGTTRIGGGLISPVVEPAGAVMTTTTRTGGTVIAAKTLSNAKACNEDVAAATGSSTLYTASMSTIHTTNTVAPPTMRGLNYQKNPTTAREGYTTSIMTDKRELAERKQQLRPKAATTDPSSGADPTMPPGSVSVASQGNHQHALESPIEEVSPPSVTFSLSNTTLLLSAKLVNDDEIRQEVRQEAEAEMRHMAQAEFQRMMEEAAVTQATPVVVDVEEEEEAQHVFENTKLQTRRRYIMIACSIPVVVVVVAVIVTVVATVSGMGRGGRGDANTMDTAMPADIKTVDVATPPDETAANGPTPGPTNGPTVAAPPADETVPVATPPAGEMVPSAAPPGAGAEQQPLFWPKVGNDINGMEEQEEFGRTLSFSSDGNTIVGSASVWNNEKKKAAEVGQVRAYSYQEDSSDWKQLGQYITGDLEIEYHDEVSLSPNGKYLAVATSPVSGANFVRIFTLEKVKNNATDEDSVSAFIWKQIGSDLYSPQSSAGIFYSISLMDSLVVAVGTESYSVFIYRYDTNNSVWVPMGQAIQGMVNDTWFGLSLQLAVNRNGTVIPAIGGTDQVHVYRYNNDTDFWVDISKTSGDGFGGAGALVGLSMDASTLGVGVWMDVTGISWGIDLIRVFSLVFSLDTESYDWLQLGKDIQDPSLTFGKSSLSANGTVLATTTMGSGVIPEVVVTGEVRIWDYVGCHADGDGGEWIQRGSPLQGSRGSSFGDEVALSSDGGRLAISAITALNNQDIHTGKLQVFAVANNATLTMTPKELCTTAIGSFLRRGSVLPSSSLP